jgi:hypothetical protein
MSAIVTAPAIITAAAGNSMLRATSPSSIALLSRRPVGSSVLSALSSLMVRAS